MINEKYEDGMNAVTEWHWLTDNDKPKLNGTYIVCTDGGAVFTAHWWDDHFQPHGDKITNWMMMPNAPTKGQNHEERTDSRAD